jgi:hypothetical protein
MPSALRCSRARALRPAHLLRRNLKSAGVNARGKEQHHFCINSGGAHETALSRLASKLFASASIHLLSLSLMRKRLRAITQKSAHPPSKNDVVAAPALRFQICLPRPVVSNIFVLFVFPLHVLVVRVLVLAVGRAYLRSCRRVRAQNKARESAGWCSVRRRGS